VGRGIHITGGREGEREEEGLYGREKGGGLEKKGRRTCRGKEKGEGKGGRGRAVKRGGTGWGGRIRRGFGGDIEKARGMRGGGIQREGKALGDVRGDKEKGRGGGGRGGRGDLANCRERAKERELRGEQERERAFAGRWYGRTRRKESGVE